MPLHTVRTVLLLPLLAPLAAPLLAQSPSTAPLWSTFFGGDAYDEACTVRVGPNGHLFVVGVTNSSSLVTTPGSFQPLASNTTGQPWQRLDAFVMRIDPSQPPQSQVVWCTYFGGSDLDIPLDATIDGQGNVTVVGATMSTDLPMNATTPGFGTSLVGGLDGFVAEISADGSTLRYASYYGGTGDDWLCRVARNSTGHIIASGVTSSSNLPSTAGTIWPTYRGGINDACIARIDPTQPPAQQLLWSTYVGGPGLEGQDWPSFFSTILGQWPGNLRRQGLVVDQDEIWLATEAAAGAATTAGCFQPACAGARNAYLVHLDGNASTVFYGTYFGGSSVDRPGAMARHPRGGLVMAGYSLSMNMPTTSNALQATNRGGTYGLASDGFLCWLDPAQVTGSHLRYSTFVGGSAGEDLFNEVAVDTAGTVTAVGAAIGGGALPFPTTARCLLPAAAGSARCGAIVRLRLEDPGTGLRYGTLAGGSWTVYSGLALDAVGDVFVAGGSEWWSYPTVNAFQTAPATPLDAVLTHLPLMPGGVERFDAALAVPACAPPSAPLHLGTNGAPLPNTPFAITITNAPPLGVGTVVFGPGPSPAPVPMFNVSLLVDQPLLGAIVLPDALGYCEHPLVVPAGLPTGVSLHCQAVLLTSPACPGTGPFATSERLRIL